MVYADRVDWWWRVKKEHDDVIRGHGRVSALGGDAYAEEV